MAFVDIGNPKRGRGSWPKGVSNMTIVKSGRKDHGDYAVQLTINPACMKQMRWVIGDMVSVAFDNQDPTLVLVKRVIKNGRTISASGGKARSGSGELRGIVKFTMPEYLPFKWQDKFICESPKEELGGLVFQFVSQ